MTCMRAASVLLTVAAWLAAVAGVPETGLPSDQTAWQEPTAACPPGVALLELGPAAGTAAARLGQQSEGLFLRPSVFALPAEVTWGEDLLEMGTWEEAQGGGQAWRLCVAANESVLSLTLLFRELQLPYGAELVAYAPGAERGAEAEDCSGPACQRLQLHRLPTSGGAIVGPIAGHVAVLEYREPPGSAQRSTPLRASLQASLLGVRELPLPRLRWVDSGRWLASSGEEAAPTAAAEAAGAVGAAGGRPFEPEPSVALSGAPPGAAAAEAGGGGGGEGRALREEPTLSARLPQPDVVQEAMENILRRRAGSALECEVEAACDPDWAEEANAVVLILAFDDRGGAFCTGTLLNAPEGEQYIASATHCLAVDDSFHTSLYWGALFHYEPPCGERNYTNVKYDLLQGLEVVWHNEVSDWLLLRLEDEIPEDYSPYFLGWNASTGAKPEHGEVCIHHARGDRKKIAYSEEPVEMGSHLLAAQTHYVVTWDRGVTEDGSSGAMLIDRESRLGVGVLTGSTSAQPSCRGSSDYFGAMYEAWEEGLWEYLSPGGPDSQLWMGPRQPVYDGPGLIVDPDQLLVQAGDSPANLRIRLSDPPTPGETLSVRVAVAPAASPPVNTTESELRFTELDWDVPQMLGVFADNGGLEGSLPFRIVLRLRSSLDDNFYKRRAVPGVRVDAEVLQGLTPMAPIPITSLRFRDTGRLLAARPRTAQLGAPELTMGKAPLDLVSRLLREGSAVYYSLAPASPSTREDLTIAACSRRLALRVVVFVDGIAQWSTAEDCGVTNPGSCIASEDRELGCSGFEGIRLPATNASNPHTVLVYSLSSVLSNYSFRVLPCPTPLANLTDASC